MLMLMRGMKMSDEISKLIRSVEQVRSEKFPEIDDELVKSIILIEADFLDDRKEAMNKITQLMRDYNRQQEE
jgi:hypothetical protein